MRFLPAWDFILGINVVFSGHSRAGFCHWRARPSSYELSANGSDVRILFNDKDLLFSEFY